MLWLHLGLELGYEHPEDWTSEKNMQKHNLQLSL